jgi:2-keto-4-pentenoate hydratase
MQVAKNTLDAGGSQAADIAAAFRQGRLSRTPLAGFPGSIPGTLDEAYTIQRAAISAWPDAICGWKVGRILGDLVNVHGTDRLIGPVFARNLKHVSGGQPVEFTAIEGGFCAVEPELVFRLGADAPVSGGPVDATRALSLVDDVLIGIEIAGSPLATINDLGPCVVVSDFGNNAGLILGPSLADWRNRLGTVEASTHVDGAHVGTGSDAAFPGGITQSLVFAINQAASMGLPLKAGMLVSTGAISGVHDILWGQSARCSFGVDGSDGAIDAVCVSTIAEVRS